MTGARSDRREAMALKHDVTPLGFVMHVRRAVRK